MAADSTSASRLAAEYLGWIVAPIPFNVPWLAYAARTTEGGLKAVQNASLAPSFNLRLKENCGLWLSSYTTAFLVFLAVRKGRNELKYTPHSPPCSFVFIEMARSFRGILMLTAFQGCMLKRSSSASQRLSGLKLLLVLLGVAIWGDLHFYMVHRLMHVVPALYQRAHKVHHQSRNPDPWSGLSMHPVEHALYFSALLPLLMIPSTPNVATRALSNGLILYPIPSHIGFWPFERHHWEHHTEFNYNYGSSQMFDMLFGTTFAGYRQRLAERKETAGDRSRARAAAKQAELAAEA